MKWGADNQSLTIEPSGSMNIMFQNIIKKEDCNEFCFNKYSSLIASKAGSMDTNKFISTVATNRFNFCPF